MPATVLIVDDSNELTDVLEFLISTDERFELLATAHRADEAIDLAADFQPAVIVLDQMLPQQTGEQALPYLRASCPDATIVLFSAVANDRLAESTRALADACITKSASLPELLDMIEELHAGRQGAKR